MDINFRSNYLKLAYNKPSDFNLGLKGELILYPNLTGFHNEDVVNIDHIIPFFNFYDAEEMFHVSWELNDNWFGGNE